MKRFFLTIPFLLAVMMAFGSEELDIYTYLYRQASTTSERLGILRNVADAQLTGAGQLYAEALSQLLLEHPTLNSTAQKDAADQSASLLAGLLGDVKYTAASGDLWRVVQTFNNPLIKADALIALGRIRDLDYLEQVSRILTDLNLKPTSDPQSGERVAYGAILALEKYRHPTGYLPVFFASTAWYSQRIKAQAEKSLPYIIEDPSEPLSSVIKSSSYSYENKLVALQKADESKASGVGKAGVALLALSEGHRAATQDVKQQMTLVKIRKRAIDIIRRYGNTDPTAISLLERSYREGVDLEEKLSSIAALSAIASENAARTLSSFLMELNVKRQTDNINPEDERLVRALIPALGITGQGLVRPSLQMVQNLEWTNAVKMLAIEALKKIQ